MLTHQALRLETPQDEGVSAGAAPDAQADTAPPRGYHERKATGWCTYGACPRRAEGWPDPTHQFCPRHKTRVAARQAKWVATRRSEAAGQGKCATCRLPSMTYRCPACKISSGANLPSTGVATSVDTQQDQWRRDANGWRRFRGKGQRGAPAAAISDDSALQTAAAGLERGRIALAYAHSEGVKRLGKISRDSARAAAAAVLAGAVRFVDDVVSKNMEATEWVPTRIAALRARIWEVLGDADEAVQSAGKDLERARKRRAAGGTVQQIRDLDAACAKATDAVRLAALRAEIWETIGAAEQQDVAALVDLIVEAVAG